MSFIRMNSAALILAGICSFTLAGCGQGTSPASPVEDTAAQSLASKAELKTRLNEVAESGSVGSGMAGLRNGAEALKGSESALATGLLGDLDRLEKADQAGKSDEVKSIAKSMAAKL